MADETEVLANGTSTSTLKPGKSGMLPLAERQAKRRERAEGEKNANAFSNSDTLKAVAAAELAGERGPEAQIARGGLGAVSGATQATSTIGEDAADVAGEQKPAGVEQAAGATVWAPGATAQKAGKRPAQNA